LKIFYVLDRDLQSIPELTFEDIDETNAGGKKHDDAAK
jgi:hypothetical protein